jgi:hypothetical protein
MAETKVSDAFDSFYTREQEAIDKVKTEEARTSDVPLDIGESGILVVTDMTFDSTPNQVGKDQVITKKGCPYCRVGFRVIDHPVHEGKRIQHTYWFWENEKTTRAQNFKAFLDDLENRYGLPREVRVNHKHPKELGQWFQENEHTIKFEVKAESEKNTNAINDGKRLVLTQPKDVVPMTDDVTPPPRKKETTPASTGVTSDSTTTVAPAAPPAELKVGDLVTYSDMSCKVVDVFTTKVQLKGIDDPGFEKVVLKTDVTVTA